MAQSQTIPNTEVVKKQSKYNTFISQLPGACENAALDAVEMQCKARMLQSGLGFATLAKKKEGPHGLVFSLPANQRSDHGHASRLVKRIMSQAFWGRRQKRNIFSNKKVRAT